MMNSRRPNKNRAKGSGEQESRKAQQENHNHTRSFDIDHGRRTALQIALIRRSSTSQHKLRKNK
jgi:hypothetical protein